MRLPFSRVIVTLIGNASADRVVPPTGFTARLTVFTAAAMAFLAVFAVALSLAAGRLAERWSQELARSATVRISAPKEQMATQTQIALDLLKKTEGVASVRPLSPAEQAALLEPWFGPDIPTETLPIPQLIEVIENETGFDAEGLRLNLAGAVPGAVLDDHTRWRKPLVRSADSLRMLGWVSMGLIILTTGAMITLSANAALASNAQVITVLRLVGATDDYIAGAFVRRYTMRCLTGAALGTAAAMGAVVLLPSAEETAGFLTGLGFQGQEWLWPLMIPILASVVAYLATQLAAARVLRGLT